MSITFDTLPDLIIDQVLSTLDNSDQVKLQFCNKRINRLLKYIVFEEVSVPKNRNHIKIMAAQVSRYVKRLKSSVDAALFEVIDEFPKLEHIEVKEYQKDNVFERLHSLDIKLKSFTLYLDEPFSNQPQFKFNHILKNLVKLDLALRNKNSLNLDALEVLQIANLKSLKLTADYFPPDTLVNINRNFPELKILSLDIRANRSEVTLFPTTFLNLKSLSLYIPCVQNYHQFPFQSFKKLKILLIKDFKNAGERAIKVIKENFFKQLLGLTIEIFEFSKDVLMLQNLKYANLDFCKNFDAKSMQHLLTLPKLSQLTIRNKVSDDFFQNVTCTSPLSSLTLEDCSELSYFFLKFLQFHVPSLTKLLIVPNFGRCAFEINTFRKLGYYGSTSKFETSSKLDEQPNLNLLYLKVYRHEEMFVNWVKAQTPNVFVAYIKWE